ncbi:MAG: DUF4920 domain-containing protein [Bacteroidetes bacterium]|nr:DUF4920 domain-containing protein [Bacteroidota bacterium]
MKQIKLFFAVAVAGILVCSAFTPKSAAMAATGTHVSGDSVKYYGEKFSTEGAISSLRLSVMMAGKDSLKIKLIGKIDAVCQAKGCWLKMAAGDGKMMTVRFKDYAFFAPKNASGKTAIVDGYAYTETVSVEMLKHYAEDAGKSKAEIDKITQPETSISFLASGLAIMK